MAAGAAVVETKGENRMRGILQVALLAVGIALIGTAAVARSPSDGFSTTSKSAALNKSPDLKRHEGAGKRLVVAEKDVERRDSKTKAKIGPRTAGAGTKCKKAGNKDCNQNPSTPDDQYHSGYER